MIRWLKLRYYEWRYRKVDPNLCCCGSLMDNSTYYACEGRCRSAKEYAIYNAIKG
jgi:hypothetical protein